MHLKETAFECVDWIHLALRAFAHTALNIGVYNVGVALTG